MILLHNLRLGFASNSSSAHSLIFLPDNYQSISDNYDADHGFHWENFTLASQEAKQYYLAIILNQSMIQNGINKKMRRQILNSYADFNIPNNVLLEVFDDKYIDHQSMIRLPGTYGNPSVPDQEFFNDLQKLILNDRVVVAGGNDNSNHSHPLVEDGVGESIRINRTVWADNSNTIICRKDEKYGFWTIFDYSNGSKIRFSFLDLSSAIRKYWPDFQPAMASTPELVDVTITHWCDYGCPYCYMGSTIKGKHAPYENIEKVLVALSKMKVFEVALGGGETTSHPDLVNILKRSRELGMVPNITTRNHRIMLDERAPEIAKYAGAIAFSVDNYKQVIKIGRLLEKYPLLDENEKPVQIAVQVVMGSVSREEYKNILKAAARFSIRVTLLGFKMTGRGDAFKQIPYEWWMEVIDDLSRNGKTRKRKGLYIPRFPSISVDTVMIQQSTDILNKSDVNRLLYHSSEGTFSAYIDAVNSRMGPSSYVSAEEMQTFDINEDLGSKLKSIFNSFPI